MGDEGKKERSKTEISRRQVTSSYIYWAKDTADKGNDHATKICFLFPRLLTAYLNAPSPLCPHLAHTSFSA